MDHDSSDRLVFKTIIQPRTLFPRGVIIGAGVYTLPAIIIVKMQGRGVRRVLSGYLLVLLLFAAPVLLAPASNEIQACCSY